MEYHNSNVAPMAPNETRTNLIINHLPHNLSEQEFHQIFSEMGTIKNYRIMKDLKTGASFGFGFVEYDTPESAAKAILKLNNYGLQHKRLKVSYAQPPGQEDLKDTNLYIKNIPRNYTLDQLEELFSPFGPIIQKLIFKDKATGEPNGVGFVRYKQKAQAYCAIQGMNGRVPDGGTKPLLVKFANENNKRNPKFQQGGQRFRGPQNDPAASSQGVYWTQLSNAERGRGRGYSSRGGFGRGAFSDMKAELMDLLISGVEGPPHGHDPEGQRWPQQDPSCHCNNGAYQEHYD